MKEQGSDRNLEFFQIRSKFWFTFGKNAEVFREIFQGLVNDKRRTVEFVLEELKTNVRFLSSKTKQNDDLFRFWCFTASRKRKNFICSTIEIWDRWFVFTSGPVSKNKKTRRKTRRKTKIKKTWENSLNRKEFRFDSTFVFIQMEVDEIDDDEDREEIRRLVHQFLMILLNSKIYGINFFDPTFGSSNK